MEENVVTDLRIRQGSRFGCFIRTHAGGVLAAVAWAACICSVHVGVAAGFPPLRFENAAERVTGPIGRFVPAQADTNSAQRIVIEAGRMRLFGLAELGEDGVRVSVTRRRLTLALDAVACASPVGSERSAGISMQIKTLPKFTMGIRLDGALTSLEACERSTVLTTSTLVAARISQRLSVAWLADDVLLCGEKLGGMDMSLCAAGHFGPFATAFTSIRIDRWGELSAGYAASLRMGTFLSGMIGYEGASEQIKTAVQLSRNSWTCEICVLFHPVLGRSNGIFLQWGR